MPPSPGVLGHVDTELEAMQVAAGPGEQMQRPLLKVLGGDRESVAGSQVLEEIGDTLSRLLPRVAASDPYRGALEVLAAAAPSRQRSPLDLSQDETEVA